MALNVLSGIALTDGTGLGFAFGKAEVVFERTYWSGGGRRDVPGRTYDVFPDGKRFLMIKESDPGDETEPTHLILVQNFGAELERLVPTNQ